MHNCIPSEQDGLVYVECCANIDQIEVGAVRIAEQQLQVLKQRWIQFHFTFGTYRYVGSTDPIRNPD